jgi:hypothetical protein
MGLWARRPARSPIPGDRPIRPQRPVERVATRTPGSVSLVSWPQATMSLIEVKLSLEGLVNGLHDLT